METEAYGLWLVFQFLHVIGIAVGMVFWMFWFSFFGHREAYGPEIRFKLQLQPKLQLQQCWILNNCAGLEIEPASQRSQDAEHLVMPQRELLGTGFDVSLEFLVLSILCVDWASYTLNLSTSNIRGW